MPNSNPFLTNARNATTKKPRKQPQVQKKENPFLSAKPTTHAYAHAHTSHANMTNHNSFLQPKCAEEPALSPPPPLPEPTFDELFPSLSQTQPAKPKTSAPSSLNFKSVVQSQGPSHQPIAQVPIAQIPIAQLPSAAQITQTQSPNQFLRATNQFLRPANQFLQPRSYHRNEYNDDEYDDDNGVDAYDSAYTNYYKD